MKNLFNKLGLLALGVVGAVVTFGHTVKAAADADLTALAASGTSLVNDNTGTAMGFISNIWGKSLLIGIGLALFSLASAMIIGAIFRRRKGKR